MLQSLSTEFIFLLEHYKKCNITIVQSFKSWNLEIDNGNFASGWLEFRKDNLIHTDSKILLRHNGDLKFDLMLLTKLKMNTKFPWTVPLSDILKQHVPGSNGMLSSNPFLPNPKRLATQSYHTNFIIHHLYQIKRLNTSYINMFAHQ